MPSIPTPIWTAIDLCTSINVKITIKLYIDTQREIYVSVSTEIFILLFKEIPQLIHEHIGRDIYRENGKRPISTS